MLRKCVTLTLLLLGTLVLVQKAQAAVETTDGQGHTASVTGATPAPVNAVGIGNCPLFPGDNPWNADISNAPVDPNSANYVATINAGGNPYLHTDFGNYSIYGIPYTTVLGTQPKVPITFTEWPDQSDPGPYPIPSNAPVEQDSGDRHVIVVDTDNCLLYEMYNASFNGSGWNAGSGAVFNLKSDQLRPEGWTSADAAGLPIFPGLLRYAEVQTGAINHALRFTVATSQKKYIYPARHYASTTTDPNYPPMGLRLRLKASFNISGFPPQAQIILTALKKYGMFVADNGSPWSISGTSDPGWDHASLDALSMVPGTAFEVVDGPAAPTPTTMPTATLDPSCNGYTRLNGLTGSSAVGVSGDFSGATPLSYLTDEQAPVGDPPKNPPSTIYEPGPNTTTTNHTRLYVNLGSYACVKRMYWFDAPGQGNVNIYLGAPGNWKYLATISNNLYNQWTYLDIPPTVTHFVEFEFSNQLGIGEVVFYVGNGIPPTATSAPTKTNTPMATFVPPTATALPATATKTLTPLPTNTTTPAATVNPLCAGFVKLPLYYFSTVGVSGDTTGSAPLSYMTDEQATIGDPPQNTPITIYQPGPTTTSTNHTSLYVNFGSYVCVKRLYWFDGAGQGNVNLYTGAPPNWTPLTTITNNLTNQWTYIDLPPTITHFVEFEFSNQLSIGEVAFYVGALPTSTPIPTKTFTPSPTIPTNTPTVTNMPTLIPTNTPTKTKTPTATFAPPTATFVPPTATKTLTPIPMIAGSPSATVNPLCAGFVKLPLYSYSTVGVSGDMTGSTPLSYMTDEQAAIGDPPQNAPTTIYQPGPNTTSTNHTLLYVNLGSYVCVKRLYWFDGTGAGNVNLYTGAPPNWTPLTSITNNLTNQWTSVDLPPTITHFIEFEFSNQLSIGEVAFYVGALPTSTPIPTKTFTPSPTIPTNTPTVTNTPTMTPTFTRTPTPTLTPVPPTATKTSTPISGSAATLTATFSAMCNGFVKLPLYSYSTVGVSGDTTGSTPLSYLTDEQAAIGDPPQNTPTTIYQPGPNTTSTNHTLLYVNLGSYVCVKRLYWYGGTGQGNVNLYTGAPPNWTPLTTISNNVTNQWKYIDLPPTITHFMEFEFSNQVSIGEIALYVGALPTSTPLPTKTP